MPKVLTPEEIDILTYEFFYLHKWRSNNRQYKAYIIKKEQERLEEQKRIEEENKLLDELLNV
jgi:hypothetical protein